MFANPLCELEITAIAVGAPSLEQAHDALVLFDVPAILVVVSRDRHRTNIRALRFPDAGTLHCSSCELLSRAAQFVELDLHSSQDTVELGDIAGSAVVRRDRKNAQHGRVGA